MISATPGRYSVERLTYFDATGPVMVPEMSALIKYPTAEPDITGFIKPFPLNVSKKYFLI